MKKSFSNILFLTLILCILFAIVKYPSISLKSASNGLNTWFNIVVPSLLPFFIISEILIDIGFVDFIGELLEPLIKFLFNVPGVGAFSFAISIVSGYPLGTKIVSSLRQNNLISKVEADRMICFSSTSGPLFMIGAVSTGMLNNPSLIPLIIYPHYLGAITLGFFMRFYKRTDTIPSPSKIYPNKKFNPQISSIAVKSSIGSLLANSVQKSLNTIALIGGFMILYSVLVELLFISGPFNKIVHLLHRSDLLNINLDILKGIISGLFEITTGCNIISGINMRVINKIMIINFLIGWSGFSIHSQTLSFINSTDISSKLYILAKFFHGILAALYSFLLYIIKYRNIIKPSFLPNIPINKSIHSLEWHNILIVSSKIAIFTIIYMLICSLIISLVFNMSKGD